jgi:HTH-type transcriptional regulator/antitoxin HipB
VRIVNAQDLGAYLRDRRRQLGMTQADLADAARVSRRWLSSLEAGKSSAELGLVLQALDVLGLVVDARPEEDVISSNHRVDLDAILRRHRGADGG